MRSLLGLLRLAQARVNYILSYRQDLDFVMRYQKMM